MYRIKLDDMIFPLGPSQIITSKSGKAIEMQLLSGETITLPGDNSAESFKISLLLPQKQYLQANYSGEFRLPSFYYEKLNKIMEEKRAVRLQISRREGKGEQLCKTNEYVIVEGYVLTEQAAEGTDMQLELSLKKYKKFKSTVTTETVENKIKEVRASDTKPVYRSHTVVKGDALWSIANKYLQNGNRYPELYEWNKATIDAGNAGTGNHKYTIYPGQIFVIKE